MSPLLRASGVIHRPVVTMQGEDIAQVKDVVYSAGGGAVGGFTLAGRGLFAGPLKTTLPWASVRALGPDAVMIEDERALAPTPEVLGEIASAGGSGGDVLGSEVLTEDGVALGTVADVILEVTGRDGSCDVVGYEVATDPSGTKERMFVPLPDTLAASAEHLVVPTAARDFATRDLAGLADAVTAFRNQLGERADAAQ